MIARHAIAAVVRSKWRLPTIKYAAAAAEEGQGARDRVRGSEQQSSLGWDLTGRPLCRNCELLALLIEEKTRTNRNGSAGGAAASWVEVLENELVHQNVDARGSQLPIGNF